MPRIVRLPTDATSTPREAVAVERIISGTPTQAVANTYTDPRGEFHCGIWEGDIGAWRVSYTEHELCHMLAGRVRLTADDGDVVEFTAGDSFVIPAGYTGVWEVLEPARKLYAVFEAQS